MAGMYALVRYFSYAEIERIAMEHRMLGAFLLAIVMFATTIIAPLTSLPLVPMLAPLLGPFTTGLACYIGWLLGAIVAFLIGRQYGQPFVARYIDMHTVKKYEAYIVPEMSFVFIAVLRMLIPVDLFSYALALFTTVSFRVYVYATMVGLLWFSFGFAYLGNALMDGDAVLLLSIGVASLVILASSWYYIHSVIKKTDS